jgi:kynureninase
MSALSVYLAPSHVAIYGLGVSQGNSGIFSNTSGFKFGTIYQIGELVGSWQVGNSVLFKTTDVKCRLVTQNNLTYTIIEEARLVLTDY